jgi:hypothetical protein
MCRIIKTSALDVKVREFLDYYGGPGIFFGETETKEQPKQEEVQCQEEETEIVVMEGGWW